MYHGTSPEKLLIKCVYVTDISFVVGTCSDIGFSLFHNECLKSLCNRSPIQNVLTPPFGSTNAHKKLGHICFGGKAFPLFLFFLYL